MGAEPNEKVRFKDLSFEEKFKYILGFVFTIIFTIAFIVEIISKTYKISPAIYGLISIIVGSIFGKRIFKKPE